jgi:hypothetical protein
MLKCEDYAQMLSEGYSSHFFEQWRAFKGARLAGPDFPARRTETDLGIDRKWRGESPALNLLQSTIHNCHFQRVYDSGRTAFRTTGLQRQRSGVREPAWAA